VHPQYRGRVNSNRSSVARLAAEIRFRTVYDELIQVDVYKGLCDHTTSFTELYAYTLCPHTNNFERKLQQISSDSSSSSSSFSCSEQYNTAYDSDANYEQDQQGSTSANSGP